MQLKRLFQCGILLLSVAISHAQANLSTVQTSAGQRFALSLRSDGSVWAWGTNQLGELGLGTNALAMWPTRVTGVTNAVSISAGAFHSLAAQSNGTVLAWGLNSDGRLGNGNFTSSSNTVVVTRITNAVAVSAGGNHSLALLANGSIMAWGANNGGQLGTGNTISTNQPVAVGNFTNIIAISAGTNFSLALAQDGSVWAWGTNNMGQLGLGSTTTQLTPVKITTLSNIVQIAAGASHSLAMDRNGVVYAWGRNTEGQIGNGTTVNATAPVIVPAFGATTNLGAVKFVEAGYNSSAAILKSGRLFYWGWYGNGTFWSSNQPPQELNANSGQVFTSVTYGDSYLLAGNQDGSTWAWGFNQYGTRGNGNVYDPSDTWSYQLANAEYSFSPTPYATTTRFTRGDRNDLNYLPMLPYNSFVLPLDLEKGVRLNNTGNDAYGYGASQPWFLNVQKITRQHAWQITTSTNLSRFNVDNPIVAFGQGAGGSPLYVNQPYRFGLFGGAYNENTTQTNIIRILVYSRSALASGATNVAPTNTIYISLPRRDISTDATAWSNYVTNGNRVVVSTNDLITSVSFNNGVNNFQTDAFSDWGVGWIYAIPTKVTIDGIRLTHMATSTNYCYIVEAIGQCEVGANVFANMALTNGTGWAYLPMYALGFDNFPAWRAHFLDNPNFAGTPVPPTYTGRSSLELAGLTASITNNIWITNNAAYTNLDNSPELRRSPILDQFVSDMRNDPLALANYVINNIGLTDPIAYGTSSSAVANSVELGGVNRSALGTYLEGQGSPVEQCALLVYLLRQAGYPATYVWPTNSNLQLLDTTVSRLWQVNVHGIVWNSGIPIITNSLIVVNYPWVVANIGTNSYQIFPWLKNTAVTKGQNIYDYMPTNYPDAYSWVKDFALANPALMALASPNDGIEKFWQSYLTSVINTNNLQPNISLQDFGIWSVNRPQNYTSWSQLPMPDALYNQSKVSVIQTLSDSPTTYPFLTNIFDQVRIEVFQSNTNVANRLIDTGLWDACDLHNRKLLLYTNVPNSVSLWLSSYRAGITNTSNFTNYLSSTNALLVQVAKGTITSAVTNLPVRITYQKRIGLINPTNVNIWYPSQGYYGGTFAPFNCGVRDVSAIIPSVTSVSSPMLQVWAQDYWNLEQKRATNTSYVPAATDEAGDAAMIMASSFFQKMWSDNQLNQNLHEVRALTWDSWGVAALTQLSNSKMQVKLNMNWFATFLIGNGMADQDSGDTGLPSLNNYVTMLQALGSSAEYSTIASVWPDQSPVSSLRLIQIAAQNWRTNGTAMPPELNVDNYTALGNLTYTGYGSTALKNQVPAIWNQVTNVFTTEIDSNYVRMLITPGMVTNSSGSFKGMASLIFGETQTGAMISDNQTALNGGYGDVIDWIGSDDLFSSYDFTYTLDYSPSYGSYTFVETSVTPAAPLPQYVFSAYDALNLTASTGQPQQVAYTPQQTTQAAAITAGLNLPTSSTANAIKSESDVGWFGNAWARSRQNNTVVYDPVQIVSGDFCADSVDIALAGPMPLPLHRNYQSRSLATDQIGAGWKFGIMPWLVITTNSAGNVIANAAEMDGSVLAYQLQTNGLWTVTPTNNPDLVNFTDNGIGGTANVFNNYIQQNPTNGQIYTLVGSDGSQRVFQVMTNFGIVDGTNYLNRIRPYLTLWQDHAGNYYQFIYGTNTGNNNFGQLYRIQGANGVSLTFEYDYYGRVTQVLSDDNRAVNYQYDNYGDLVGVTLPDNTTWQYGYQHYTFTTNSQTYTDSYHLLTSETKPDGRQVANTYDNLRRVIAQAATVGVNRELITNATFFYTNNCTGFTNMLIGGSTMVKDVFGNPYYYFYTNNFVTQIIEPLGVTNTLVWYTSGQTNAPAYPNSLQYIVDARGLTNWFLYDSRGNITNETLYGDLMGTGIRSDSATNTFTFTTNNVVATATDASGNTEAFNYDANDGFQLDSLQFSSGGIGVFTNRWTYTNVTTVVNMGNWYQTNSSFGLCASSIKADAATNAVAYNGRGFPTQLTRYAITADAPGNSDPAVVTYFTFSPRGDLISAVDAAGRQVSMSFDAMGRIEWRNVSDQNSNTLARETFYYDSNGELQWYDGPRSNPDDYIYFSYDGASRTVQQVRWRTQAKPDGTGIQAIPGDGLYATTFGTYDYFGNLTSVADSRGALTTNSWDALGRLVQRRAFDVGGTTQLASDGFAYEAGGLVQNYSNALGGVTTTLYTSTGQPRVRQNADGSTNGWTYYLDGRVNREIQGNGSYWQTIYNDAIQTVTRTFYSASGLPQATNIVVFDHRGNQVQFTDEGGNTFVNTYDGLNRLKSAAGPAIQTVYQAGSVPNSGIWVTNILQQMVTNFYDASGSVFTNVNALGEKSVATMDVLGRTTSSLIYSASGTLVREQYFTYSADNNSVTVTDGSGATAISHTVYTDSDGNPVLSLAYPSAYVTEFTINQFDVAGNLVAAQHGSTLNGNITTWTTASYSYDGLNRLTSKVDRDNALTTYAYDSFSDLTNRTLPGNLQWQASFNNAGQILSEQYFAGGAATRSTTYGYFTGGSPFAGLLQTETDGRGTASSFAYDSWLRLTNLTCTGSLPEQNLSTIWNYEPRGFVTGLTQQFASTNTGPSTTISRKFDQYGQLANESVTGGTVGYGLDQNWDASGRRSMLNINGVSYGYSWRADGNLIGASDSTGSGIYGFDTAGLLTSRTVGNRQTTINSRDGEGRPLTVGTTVNLVTNLSESITWTGDGLLASHILVRGDFGTDTRSYSYANLSRRLVKEQLNINGSTVWTNSMVYDNGVGGGPGVLTQSGLTGSNAWSGATDAYSRVNTETNNVSPFPAYGHVNGQSVQLNAWLDNQPVSITGVGTNAMQWRAMMDLTPGTHQLKVSALHPSLYFTAWATNSFTNSLAYQATTDSYDSEGNVTNRVWKNPGGVVERSQALSWDAFGRLHAVIDRDTNNSGFNWSAAYDALNRRVQTTTVLVSNGVASTAPSQSINSYFDPLMEFVELGASTGNQTVWKLYGPDLDGTYGGENGTGGLDGVSPYLNTFNPVISDLRGNILAEVTNGVAVWNASRPTSYGAVPGYRPAAYGSGADMAQSSAWRGRPTDITGLYNIGLRPYDPVAGRWLTFDPSWNEGDPDGYSFCAGGDPVNYFDQDGRLGKYAGPGEHILYNSQWQQIGSYSDYDAYYLGGRWAAMNRSIRHDPLAGAYMPFTDAPSEAFGGSSFRMVFGTGAAGAADFIINMDTAPIGALADVADSARQAGEASVTGEHQGFAYTRAGVSFVSAAMMFEAPVRGFANQNLAGVGTLQRFQATETSTALVPYNRAFALRQMPPVEIPFVVSARATRNMNAAQRAAFVQHLAEQEAALNYLSLERTEDLKFNLDTYDLWNDAGIIDKTRKVGADMFDLEGSGLDAAHRLDAIAGGYPWDIIGGRNPVQRTIGSLWRVNRNLIVPGRVHRLVPVFTQ